MSEKREVFITVLTLLQNELKRVKHSTMTTGKKNSCPDNVCLMFLITDRDQTGRKKVFPEVTALYSKNERMSTVGTTQASGGADSAR